MTDVQMHSFDRGQYRQWCIIRSCGRVSALLLILRVQLVHYPEGLEELGEVDAAVLVEIDAPRHVVNGAVVHVHTQVRTEQFPCLAELLDGNLTCEMLNNKKKSRPKCD